MSASASATRRSRRLPAAASLQPPKCSSCPTTSRRSPLAKSTRSRSARTGPSRSLGAAPPSPPTRPRSTTRPPSGPPRSAARRSASARLSLRPCRRPRARPRRASLLVMPATRLQSQRLRATQRRVRPHWPARTRPPPRLPQEDSQRLCQAPPVENGVYGNCSPRR